MILKKPLLLYSNWLPGKLRGMCFPPFVVIHLDQYGEDWCKRHELAHWVQYRRHGWLGYMLGYFFRWLWYGYGRHPWEIEARRRGWRPRQRPGSRRRGPTTKR